MAKLNDRELASIKMACLGRALAVHTTGKRNSKKTDESEILKTASKFEKYVTK